MRKLRRQSRVEEVPVPLDIVAKNKDLDPTEIIHTDSTITDPISQSNKQDQIGMGASNIITDATGEPKLQTQPQDQNPTQETSPLKEERPKSEQNTSKERTKSVQDNNGDLASYQSAIHSSLTYPSIERPKSAQSASKERPIVHLNDTFNQKSEDTPLIEGKALPQEERSKNVQYTSKERSKSDQRAIKERPESVQGATSTSTCESGERPKYVQRTSNECPKSEQNASNIFQNNLEEKNQNDERASKNRPKSVQDYTRKNYKELTGNDLKLLLCIHSHTKIENDFQTEYLSKDFLATAAQIKAGSIKTTVFRLKENQFLARIESRNGPGSYRRFTMDKNVYIEINEDLLRRPSKERSKSVQDDQFYEFSSIGSCDQRAFKERTNSEQNTSNRVDNHSLSSSSFNNIKNTNTTELSDEWSEVQIPHVLRSYNFGPHIIKQVRDRDLLTPSELQESLDAFAFDVTENNLVIEKKIKDPVRYFMGITNKKMQYAPSGNFINDEDKALEENRKRLEELKKKREEAERINMELAFEEWLTSLSQEEKISIVPDDIFKIGTTFHTQMLRAHFEESLRKGINPESPTLSQ